MIFSSVMIKNITIIIYQTNYSSNTLITPATRIKIVCPLTSIKTWKNKDPNITTAHHPIKTLNCTITITNNMTLSKKTLSPQATLLTTNSKRPSNSCYPIANTTTKTILAVLKEAKHRNIGTLSDNQ